MFIFKSQNVTFSNFKLLEFEVLFYYFSQRGIYHFVRSNNNWTDFCFILAARANSHINLLSHELSINRFTD